MAEKEVQVGAGKVYVQKFVDTIPEDEALEVDANLIGHTKGGITFSYSVDKNEIPDDLGEIVDSAISKEIIKVKFGMMSQDASDLEKLCSTATVTKTEGLITTEIGGASNENSDKWIVRFVHTSKTDKVTRYTILGKVEDGFSLPYALGEAMVIDCEFTGYKLDDKGTLLKVTQTV